MSKSKEIECRDLKTSVKVEYNKQGSGIIFCPKKSNDFAYVLTAKHNFYDLDKPIDLNDINKEKVLIEYKKFRSSDSIIIRCHDIILFEVDLALIVVKIEDIDDNLLSLLPTYSILSTNTFSHCIFKGYPESGNDFTKCLIAKYTDQIEENIFSIKCSPLASSEYSEVENTIGFSGSGLITSFNNNPTLVGVIIKVASVFNEIECVDLSKEYVIINQELIKKGYAEIEIIEIETIEFSKSNEIESIDNYQTSLSTKSDITVQHKEIIKKLESYDICGAKKLLKEILEPSGETFRLNALIALTDKDIALAFSHIENAKNREVVPNDLEFVKGLIYYFSSIDKKGYEKISPYPIDRLYIKTDPKSQEHIKEAQNIFQELSDKHENLDYDVWYLASLHLTDLNIVAKKVAEFIKTNPLHYGSITYITAFNFDIDLKESIIKLNEMKDKSVNHIIDLVNCYNHQKLYAKTVVLLEENKNKFEDNSELLEKCYINTYMLDEKFDEALDVVNQSSNESIKRLESNIIIEKYYSTSQWDELVSFFGKDLTIENLYNICKVKAIQNDWEYISDHAIKLLEEMPLLHILDLVVTAKYNSKDYKSVLEILESYNNIYSDLNEKLKRIKSNCLLKFGNPKESIMLLESLENKTPEDIFTLIDMSKKIGDSEKVEKLVHDFYITNKNSLNVREKLQLGNIIKDDSPTFANKIYQSALSEKITDKEKAGLILESLGMPDNKLFNEIINTPFVASVNLGDEFNNSVKQNQLNIYQNYLRGNIPFHKLDNQRYLIESFNPQNKKIFFSRAGNRISFINIDSKIKNIYCDISSLLLIDSLDLFENIFSKFETIYIPMNTMEYINNNGSNTTLKKELNYYIEHQKILFTEELSEDVLNEETLVYTLEKSLKYILKTNLKENSIILFDDRATNKYLKTDKADIFTINDLIYTLFQCGILSEDIYYQKLLFLREKNFMYIPFNIEELIYQLEKASIEENKLVETSELIIIRKHFASTIQNLHYLSIKEDAMTESHFFSNVNNLIENIYFELWNLNKDKWDIYFEYLQENFYIINLGYFIRNTAPKLNVNSIISLNLSSLIYVGFFMIKKDHALYIEKIENNFLEPILYGNEDLMKEFINTLKIYLLQENKYDAEDKKALLSLESNFINELPFKIRNKLIEDVKIRKKFDFVNPMQLWDKTVDLDKLLIEIENVLNKGIKARFENFDIYLDNNEILIKNLKTLDIKNFSVDFYILSQNKTIRNKTIENNDEWFDYKKSRKKQIIKKIQSVQNPLKRFEELEKYKRLSPEHYYNSLFEQSKKTNTIDFNYIVPEHISLVSNYFRFELINDYRKNKKIYINELLKDKNLSTCLHKLFALPQELTMQVFTKVNSLSHKKQINLLKEYSEVVATPLNIFHLVKLINNTARNKKFAKRVIRRILNKFSKNSLVEIKAYLAVYKYMYYRFKKEFDIERNLLYMLSFGHTDKVFRNFLALGIGIEQLEKIFTQKTKFDSCEIFDFENRTNVLHPLEINSISFLFKGLNYSLKDNLCFDISIFKEFAYIEDNKIPSYQLFKNFSLLDNKCNSFMDKDYENLFNNIFENEENYFSNNFLMKFSDDTVNDLKESPEKVVLFNGLSAIFDNTSIYKDNRNDLLDLMNNINFEKLDDKYYTIVINFISKQNIYLKDRKLNEKIKAEVISKCILCNTEKEISQYFDSLVYLSISSSDNIEDRILYFTNLLRKIETDLNRNLLKVALKNIVMSLPLNESNILSEYLVDLRRK